MTALPRRVNILVLNYNGWRDTLECLESVFRSDYQNVRVILCDNASTNESLERVREWANGRFAYEGAASSGLAWLSQPPVSKPIRYVEYDQAQAEAGGGAEPADPPLVIIRVNTNRGFTGGNNVGLRYLLARRETGYVCLLNNDTVIAPSCIRCMVDVAEADESLGAVGGTILEYHMPDVIQAAGGGWVSLWHGGTRAYGAGVSRAAVPRGPIQFVSGCCMLVRMSTVQQAGILDERFFIYGDDTDWCVRMRAQGFEMAFAPEAEIWHKGSKTTVSGTPTNDYHNVRSALLFVQKFRPHLMPAALMYSLYRCALPKIVRGQWARLRAVGRAYANVFGLSSLRRDADRRTPVST